MIAFSSNLPQTGKSEEKNEGKKTTWKYISDLRLTEINRSNLQDEFYVYFEFYVFGPSVPSANNLF